MLEQALYPTTTFPSRRVVTDIPRPDWPRRLTLPQFLDLHKDTPSHILGLGTCDDGLPVFFDLRDPRPGALLLIGDSATGKTPLLRTMLASGLAWKSPLELNFAVVTARPEDYSVESQQSSYSRGVWDPFSIQTAHELVGLAELTEQRLAKPSSDITPILLILEDLSTLRQLDSGARLNLEWLFQNGPAAGVWPVATLRTADALAMSRTAHYFGTHLLGKMSRLAAHRLAYGANLNTEALQPGRQFAVKLNRSFLKFWLPQPSME